MFGRPLRAGFRAQKTLGRGPIRVGQWSNVRNAFVQINGQSNALGVGARSELSQSPLSSDPDLATFDAAAFARVMIWVPGSNAFVALENGVNQQAFTTGSIGPEFGLAVRWMRETDVGTLYIVKTTGDGSAISQWRDGQTLFETAQSRYTSAGAWLASNAVSISDYGWIWVQGESDSAQTQSYYYGQLTALQSERAASGMSQTGEVQVIAQMVSGTLHYSAAIVAAKAQFVSETAGAHEVTFAAYLNGDNLHLNARGQLQLGYDAYSAIFNAGPLSA